MPYTPGMREVLKLSKAEAGRLGHDYIGPEHYMLGIIRKGDGLAVQTLNNLSVDLEDLKQEIERSLEIGKSPTVGLFTPNADAKRVLESAKHIATQMNHGWIGTEHLLLALIREEGTKASEAMLQLGVDYDKAHREVLSVIDGSQGAPKAKASAAEKSRTPALDTFGRDLTELAKEGKLDPVIGREDEIERILQILCRRTKNNPILLGEPGVGKTAIVEGLAQKIVADDVPELLAGKRLLSLDLAAVVAGTKYRGQFEERLKQIMHEIRKSRDVLIFIDELHTLVGAGAAEGAIDASNMLKPALSRGEIQCIGATTLEEYRKYIEKDGALERRFQSITVDPPSIDETIEILKGLRRRYEAHHNIIISDEAIICAAKYSDRYITDRWLPDKAIDLVDEAGSRARLQASVKPPEVKACDKKIAEYLDQLQELSQRQEFEKCQALKEKKEQTVQERDQLLAEWKERKNDSEFTRTIDEDDIVYIVSKWTGIPVTRLEQEEMEKLRQMEDSLGKRVVDQEEAISAIARAIRRSRAGLKMPQRPVGSFIFLGPTGVGKTELAKALTEFLFGDEDALIRIDMSEYMEKYAVSRLLGAAPGYVGYEEGGQLTEKVRQKPYSVVLFDEIEKAHPDIWSILLQILDEGRLTDSWGHVVDFRNTVIILTSNIGTKRLGQGNVMGFTGQGGIHDFAKVKERVMSELKKTFNPELVNRLDEIIIFHALSEASIAKIVDIFVTETNDRLKERNITVTITPEARDLLAKEGYDSEYGARPLRRAMQKLVEDPISTQIIEGQIPDNCKVEARKAGEELVFIVVEKYEDKRNKKKELVRSASDSSD
ncbi:ATP-dependent Clp protease ATP-binding subunit [Candidatus Sumerlaeota bacterium]|nr:ATP-dependent Clp protease ATP-binding subunit [Candidatus Sumerlaeota bacterium]